MLSEDKLWFPPLSPRDQKRLASLRRKKWQWVGFSDKTLWNWLQLLGVLAIPPVLVLGTLWLSARQSEMSEALLKNQHETALAISQQQRDTEQAIAADQQRETTLNTYFDRMSALLLDKNWKDPQAGAGLRALARARTLTALRRGSIYHSFGDKRSLYIQTLERYGHTALQQATAFWSEAEPSLGNFRAFLMVIVDLPEVQKRRGSMICNCIVEVVPHDPEIAKVVEGMLNEFKRVLQSVLERAKQAGELGAHANTTALARYLVSSMQGLCVTAKAGAPRAELLDIVEVTLSALQ